MKKRVIDLLKNSQRPPFCSRLPNCGNTLRLQPFRAADDDCPDAALTIQGNRDVAVANLTFRNAGVQIGQQNSSFFALTFLRHPPARALEDKFLKLTARRHSIYKAPLYGALALDSF